VKDKRHRAECFRTPKRNDGPSLFWISATLNPDKDPKEVEENYIRRSGTTEERTRLGHRTGKVRMLVRRAGVEQLQSTQGRAPIWRIDGVYNDETL
jgi:hypothetical protein